MPEPDKKIVYLDQLAISQIFKIESGTYPTDAPHHGFWREVSELLKRCVLLQRLLCPTSDIHRDESMVFTRGDELSLVHEMLGGDTSFIASSKIEADQVWAYLEAFVTNTEPALNFSVDEILHGSRNDWLPKLHVSAVTDWTSLVTGVREQRELSANSMTPLYERWRSNPETSFKSVLETEIEAFGSSRISAYLHFSEMARQGLESGDTDTFMKGALSGPVQEFRELREYFRKAGLEVDDAERQVVSFWRWSGNRSIPHHRIQAYLFAAMARKIVAGQKKNPTRGAPNDIRAIATYAPYVDAMFVDSEFAALLQEAPLKNELQYKAKVFSIRTQEAFLDYLRELVRGATIETEMIAVALYGDGARRNFDSQTVHK